MDNPLPAQTPESVLAAAALKAKNAREAALKQNRNISHMLKSGAMHQHAAKRTMPHVRGR
ncbi:MAG TPA: hypothetical protein VMC06_14370 [Opitutaceae bacterium]|nr:hypothetical protein [Opitutaceae bacterium]